MKNKFKIIENIALILFFVVWTGVAIFFWLKIAGHIENKEIVKNGITLNAEVVDYDTNMSINKVNYYYMTYMFEIDGEAFYGQTSTTYKLNEVTNTETIEIKFYNGKSIEADYDQPKDLKFSVLFLVVTSVLSLVFAIILFLKVYKKIYSYRTEHKGNLTTATVVNVRHSSTATTKILGKVKVCNYYSITCKFTKKDGKVFEGKAIGTYAEDVTNYFKNLNEIKIKYIGNKFVIVEPTEGIDIYKNTAEMQIEDKPDYNKDVIYFECENCGEIVIPNNDATCPKCLKIIRKYKEINKDVENWKC